MSKARRRPTPTCRSSTRSCWPSTRRCTEIDRRANVHWNVYALQLASAGAISSLAISAASNVALLLIIPLSSYMLGSRYILHIFRCRRPSPAQGHRLEFGPSHSAGVPGSGNTGSHRRAVLRGAHLVDDASALESDPRRGSGVPRLRRALARQASEGSRRTGHADRGDSGHVQAPALRAGGRSDR